MQHEGNSNNIIILLDEIDAFFHPKYQINIISELLEVISKGFEKYNIHSAKILDIGCGGGFPCVPLAIEYPEFKITGIDSIKKKIDAINEIKNQVKLDNLSTICDRVENIKGQKFDVITSQENLFRVLLLI